MTYYMATTLDARFEDAVERTRAALAEEGFGVLTEIDVAATMKKKLDEEFRPYLILGACNPQLAFRALQAEAHIGALLPCNVIVQEREGTVEIAAVDPVVSLGAVDTPGLKETAEEVRTRLQRALNAL